MASKASAVIEIEIMLRRRPRGLAEGQGCQEGRAQANSLPRAPWPRAPRRAANSYDYKGGEGGGQRVPRNLLQRGKMISFVLKGSSL